MENDFEKRIAKLETYVINHEEDIKNNRIGISSNSQRIDTNTGALEILKAFKSDSHRFFIMWIITFIALLSSLVYIVYLLNDTSIVTTSTQEVEQSNDSGDNNYIGRDGDINGKAES